MAADVSPGGSGECHSRRRNRTGSRTGLDGLPGDSAVLIAQLDQALLPLLAGLPLNLANSTNLKGRVAVDNLISK